MSWPYPVCCHNRIKYRHFGLHFHGFIVLRQHPEEPFIFTKFLVRFDSTWAAYSQPVFLSLASFCLIHECQLFVRLRNNLYCVESGVKLLQPTNVVLYRERKCADTIDTVPVPGLAIANAKIRYDTRCYFNVRSKADMSRLNLPHGNDN